MFSESVRSQHLRGGQEINGPMANPAATKPLHIRKLMIWR